MYAHLFGWEPSFLRRAPLPILFLSFVEVTHLTSLPYTASRRAVLALDLYLNTRWQFELHQSVDCLWSRRVDVDNTLESAELELLASLLVYEGRTVYSENLLAGWEWHRTTNNCVCAAYSLHNLLCRLVYQVVIERLELDSNLLIHICCSVSFLL